VNAPLRATYLVETPLDPAAVAEVMAGEQSCGTFARVEGETDALRARARAVVESIDELESVGQPSLPNALLARQGRAETHAREMIDRASEVDIDEVRAA